MRHAALFTRILLTGLVLVVGAFTAPAVAGADVWTSIGPEGGSIQCLAVNPLTPSTLYAGTYLGGVFKSTNAGASWTTANTGLENFDVETLLVDPQTPSTLYALTHGGLYKSVNSGGSWSLLDTTDIFFHVFGSVVMDPQTPSTLYGSGGQHSVYKTTDGGTTWDPADTGLPQDALVLGIAPSAPATLYGWDGGNLYKTTNGGGNWGLVSEELDGKGDIVEIVVDPASADTLYVRVVSGGVYKSINGGVNWNPAKTGLSITFLYDLAIDPVTPSTLYAAGHGYQAGVYKSTNGGANWSMASSGLFSTLPGDLPHAYAHALAIDPVHPSTLYVGLWDNDSPGQVVIGGGIYKSTNSAGTWSPINSGLKNLNIDTLAVDPGNAAKVYGGVSPGAVYRTTNRGASWDWRDTGLSGVTWVTAVVVDPQTTSTLYAGVHYAGVYKSVDSGDHWAPVNTGLFPGSIPVNVLDVAINPVNPDILYAGTGDGVFKTIDGGDNWVKKSSGLPSSMDVQVLAVDPLAPDTLYAGGYMAGVYRSINGGDLWTEVNTGLEKYSSPYSVYALAVDPQTAGVVYAGTSTAGVFKTVNSGSAWSPASTGLPEDPVFYYINANALAIDPQDADTLYVGLASVPGSQYSLELVGGVYKSEDGGAHWALLDGGLLGFKINELAISPAEPATLYAATQGGGIFEIHAVTAPPGAFNLSGPADGAAGVSLHPTLSWGASSQAAGYAYCLCKSSPCGGPWTGVETNTSVSLADLEPLTTYYWQVRAANSLGTTFAGGSEEAFHSFTTGEGFQQIFLPRVQRGL